MGMCKLAFVFCRFQDARPHVPVFDLGTRFCAFNWVVRICLDGASQASDDSEKASDNSSPQACACGAQSTCHRSAQSAWWQCSSRALGQADDTASPVLPRECMCRGLPCSECK